MVKHLSKEFEQEKLDSSDNTYNKFKRVGDFTLERFDFSAVSKDAQYVAIGYTDKTLCVYDRHENFKLIYKHESEDDFTRVKFSRDGSLVFAMYDDGGVIIHDMQNKEIWCQYNHDATIKKIRLSCKGTYFSSLCNNYDCFVYDIPNKKRICELNHAHNNNNTQEIITHSCNILFSNDEKYVLLGCDCGMFILHDIKKNRSIKIKHEIDLETIIVGGTDCLFSKDSKYLLLAIGKEFTIIDINKAFFACTLYSRNAGVLKLEKQQKKDLFWHYVFDDYIFTLRLSGDGKLLAVTTSSQVALFNLAQKKKICEILVDQDFHEEDSLCYGPVCPVDMDEQENELERQAEQEPRELLEDAEFGQELRVQDDLDLEEEGEYDDESDEEYYDQISEISFVDFARHKDALIVVGAFKFGTEGFEGFYVAPFIKIYDLKDLIYSKNNYCTHATINFVDNTTYRFFSKQGRYLCLAGEHLHVIDLEEKKSLLRYNLGLTMRTNIFDLQECDNDCLGTRFTPSGDKLIIAAKDKITIFTVPSEFSFNEKKIKLVSRKKNRLKKRIFSALDKKRYCDVKMVLKS